jgi:hypothetical protein
MAVKITREYAQPAHPYPNWDHVCAALFAQTFLDDNELHQLHANNRQDGTVDAPEGSD